MGSDVIYLSPRFLPELLSARSLTSQQTTSVTNTMALTFCASSNVMETVMFCRTSSNTFNLWPLQWDW